MLSRKESPALFQLHMAGNSVLAKVKRYQRNEAVHQLSTIIAASLTEREMLAHLVIDRGFGEKQSNYQRTNLLDFTSQSR